ncbi:SGNH/GDSL hydrolase family protein [Thermoleophilum album]|uniref:GDSL-like Lipase/Acylhydrolase family protein n=1 Tax=Thermoleophilum album TaxID=29539 RepID=A0A1H6FZQ5_THEAL|nr:SGNH/GDSL hydrolase family protein [Thermoleophilum album]SEH15872.1 GDSL-like Lipase/Acylhydrolase family protein [Thermoleophilum album]
MGGRGALRRLRVSVLAALAVATLVLASPGAALGRARYVALGDSYSSGTGTGNYFDRQCLRSEQAYPAVVASARGDLDLVFEACSGATTDDLLREQLDGLNAETRWVTVTIGGNDIGFADIVVACASASLAGNCEQEIAEGERKARDELPAKLDRTYRAIRERAPNARVLVLGYPRLFQDRGRPPNCTGGALFTPERIERLNRGAEMLRDIIRARVEAAGPGFYFLDAIPVFEGHEVCSPNPWINGVMTEIVSSYHPNRFGHFSGYGRMVLDAMERIPRAERTASPGGGQGLDARSGGGSVRALRGCPVAARAAFTAAGIGRFRLGTAARTLERLVGAPQARSRAVWTWCVRGGGAVTVQLRRGRVIAVFSNARGHSYRGLAVGRPVTAARQRRLGLARRGPYLVARDGVFVRVRSGRVAYVAVASATGRRQAR